MLLTFQQFPASRQNNAQNILGIFGKVTLSMFVVCLYVLIISSPALASKNYDHATRLESDKLVNELVGIIKSQNTYIGLKNLESDLGVYFAKSISGNQDGITIFTTEAGDNWYFSTSYTEIQEGDHAPIKKWCLTQGLNCKYRPRFKFEASWVPSPRYPKNREIMTQIEILVNAAKESGWIEMSPIAPGPENLVFSRDIGHKLIIYYATGEELSPEFSPKERYIWDVIIYGLSNQKFGG